MLGCRLSNVPYKEILWHNYQGPRQLAFLMDTESKPFSFGSKSVQTVDHSS